MRAPPTRERDVRIPADSGIVLAGTWSGARSDTLATAGAAAPVAPSPAALLLSGSGPQDRDGARADVPGYAPFRDIAGALVARGVQVLRLDDRGTGASTGRFAGATTYDFARDAAAALRWLRAQPGVDPRRIVLVGHSEGALVALLVAADDSLVAALALLGAPARSGRELARWQRRALVSSDGAAWPREDRGSVLARAEVEAERVAQRDPWMRAWFDLDPRVVARRVRVPVLLLHGETDRQVPVEEAATLAEALRAGGDARPSVVRFPSTNHLFLADADGDPRGYARLAERRVRGVAVTRLADWIARITTPSRTPH